MSNTFQVIFQSRSSDGVECEGDMVLFHAGDLKQLKLKAGMFVVVETGSTSLLCRAWTSKKCTAGVITLNKLWSFSFSNDSRKASVTVCPSPRFVFIDCHSLFLLLQNN